MRPPAHERLQYCLLHGIEGLTLGLADDAQRIFTHYINTNADPWED
jgi:hypothetical protein